MSTGAFLTVLEICMRGNRLIIECPLSIFPPYSLHCVRFSAVLSVATLVLTSAEQRYRPQESEANLKAIRLSFLRTKDNHFHPIH
jgi:hypothetical protein